MEVLANHNTLGGGCASVVANIQQTNTTEWDDFWNEEVKKNTAMKEENDLIMAEHMQVKSQSFLSYMCSLVYLWILT